MSCLRGQGEETTQDVTVTSWMTCAQQSVHGSIQTAIKDEVSMSPHECALRLCRNRCRGYASCFMCSHTIPQPTR